MRKNEQPFQVPQRQSEAAIIIFIYNFLVRILRGAWPILLVLLFRSGDEQSRWEILTNGLVLFGGLFSLGVSIVAYYRYFYHVKDEQLIIQQGVFNRSRTKLPFERIQNLHIEQNVLHRLLSVVSLRIESAGSTGSEVTIDALKRPEAELLWDYIFEQKEESATEPGSEAATAGPQPSSLVLQLRLADLLRVGVTQNHLATAGVIVGGVFGFVFTVAGTIGKEAWEKISELSPRLQPDTFMGYVNLAVALFVVAFVVTLLRTVSRYYQLRFYEQRDAFSLHAGLLNRREARMQKRKIQLVRWADNPLRRLLGLYRLSIHQAVSGRVGRRENISIPGCRQAQVDDVLHSSFEGVKGAAFETHGISKHYYLWFWRFYGLLPGLIFGGLWWFFGEPRFALPAFGFPILALIYLRVYQQRFQLGVSAAYLRTVRGVLGRSYDLLPMYKVQSVSITQSFYQRRRQLATVQLFTAGGDLAVPFVPLRLARALQDYVLYQVESSQEEWM
ncbi:MAG: PH domain-containing protein [Bacteroidetes bacterium]|jgi:putative membrane protein|nr:PH domain-containing protein [Bacteroidota bacterium]